jgi:hypothetical protein
MTREASGRRALRDNRGMKSILETIAIAAALCVAGPATAAEIQVVAQALVHARDGNVQGCGVRLTGGEPAAGASAWFDVSFNVFRRGAALAQSIAYEIRRSSDGDARPARVPVQSTWIKAPQGSARLGENTERRETLVYPLVLDEALGLFRAVAAGEALTVGIKRWDQPKAAVYGGKPVLSGEARQAIGNCLARLVE